MRHALPIATALALALAVPAAAAAPAFAVDPAGIDAAFKDFGAATPGCAVGVYSAGKVLYAKGYGMADLNLGVPITPTTVFDIGSTSKQFTAASIILLAQDGKLALSDDVRKYIPELPDYGHLITIDNLLRHTSGLRDYDGLLYLAGHYFEDFTDDEDALAIITAQKALNFTPGSRFSYSNTGFFLMSVIVKRVSGQTLAQFAKARLFTPLGMEVSHYRDDHTAILKDRAVGYDPADKGFKIDMSDWDQLGDGAVNTNVLELARWDANFSAPKVGGQAMVDAMGEAGKLDSGAATGYGRGQFLDTYRGLRRIHHGGAWAGYRAMLMRFPDQGLSIGLTCNISNARTQDRAERVADVVLAKAFTQPPPATATPTASPAYAGPKLDPRAIAGDYVSEAAQSAVVVVVDKGEPAARLFGQVLPLVQVGPRRLMTKGYPIELEFGPGGELKLTVFGEPDPPYRRVAAVRPSPAETAALAGRYRSAELGTEWAIRVDKGVAYVKGRAQGEHALEPVTREIWLTDEGFFAPLWSADGRVTGFDFSASRMTRIRFDRVG